MYMIWITTDTTRTLYWISENLLAACVIAYEVTAKTEKSVRADIVDKETGEILRSYIK